MRLSAHLTPRRILPGLRASTKEEALREMAELLAATTPSLSAPDLLAALEEREKQGPFSMAKGSAFPHARTEKVDDFTIALGTSPKGVDFRAPDGRPIRIIVLFVIPRKHSNLYLHTLASFLSFFQVEEHVRRVLEAGSPEKIIAVIDELGPKPKDPSPTGLPLQTVPAAHLDTPVSQISERMRTSRLDAIPVVDTAGDLLGEIRSEALSRVLSERGTKPTTPLSAFPDLLLRNGIFTVQETAPPAEAARSLSAAGAPCAYVLRGRRLLGRLSTADLPKP